MHTHFPTFFLTFSLKFSRSLSHCPTFFPTFSHSPTLFTTFQHLFTLCQTLTHSNGVWDPSSTFVPTKGPSKPPSMPFPPLDRSPCRNPFKAPSKLPSKPPSKPRPLHRKKIPAQSFLGVPGVSGGSPGGFQGGLGARRARTRRAGARRLGPDLREPEGWGPKITRLFFLLPPQISRFLFCLDVFS